jgi:hypothetical protein
MKPAAEGDFRAFFLRNALPAALLGLAAVVSVLPLNLIVFGVWLVLFPILVSKDHRPGFPGRTLGAFATHLAVMGLVVAAAHHAPGKATERYLDRELTLPSPRMTLAELSGDHVKPRLIWTSDLVTIEAPRREKEKVIAFPGTTITLRDFVRAIEEQSTLRHEFGHCGNGWTILRGPDCSFGLRLGP